MKHIMLVTATLLATATLLSVGAISVFAQRSYTCVLDIGLGVYQPWLNSGGATAWQKGSAITLYIVSPTTGGFTSGQITDIESALGNWSTTAGTNLTITDSVVTSTPSSFASQYILVQFGSTSACGDGLDACTNANYNTTTGYPTYSTINVSSSIGSTSLGPLMAHEMGHTYIIADCPDDAGCSPSLTIMDPNEITTSSPTSPICCDLDLLYAMTPTNHQGAVCN
jgi:hypothetical protein